MNIRFPNRKTGSLSKRWRPTAALMHQATRHLPGRKTVGNQSKQDQEQNRRPGRRKWIVVGGLLAGLTLLVGSAVYAADQMLFADVKTIYFSDDGRVIRLETTCSTVEEVLREYQVELMPGDLVAPAREAALSDGDQIKISRSMVVNISDPDQIWQVRLMDGSVQEALDLAGVELGQYDEIYPELDADIEPGAEITIDRVEYKTITQQREIAYAVTNRQTEELKLGTEQVSQEGENGMKTCYIQVKYRNGEEISRELVDEEITKEPVNKVVLVGTMKPVVASRKKDQTTGSKNANSTTQNKPTPTPSANPGKITSNQERNIINVNGVEYSYSRVESGTASAYSHGNNKNGVAQRTATGTWPKRGTVAVDPQVIPLGTRLYIEGYGFGVAEDTGGRFVKGTWIDLFMESESECYSWGLKQVTYYILD